MHDFRFPSTSDWSVPTEVVVGIGSVERAAKSLATKARSVLVVSDESSAGTDTVERWCSRLASTRVCVVPYRLPTEHGRLSEAATVADVALTASADYLIAVGGPHVIDVAKVGGLIARSCAGVGITDLLHLHESTTWPIRRSMPVIAVPTTVGTATEVSPTAVLADRDGSHLLRHFFLRPSCAVLDPLATASLSREQALTGAVEALTQVLVPPLMQPSGSRLADELVVAIARCILDHADTIAYKRTPPIVRTLDTHHLAIANTAAMINAGLTKWRADRGNQLWHLAHPTSDALGLPVADVVSRLLGPWLTAVDTRLGPESRRVTQILGMLSGGSAVIDPAEWIHERLATWGIPERLTVCPRAYPDAEYLTEKVWTASTSHALTVCRGDIVSFFRQALDYRQNT